MDMSAKKFCYECSALIVREATRCKVCGAGQPDLAGVDAGQDWLVTQLPAEDACAAPAALPEAIQAPRFAAGPRDRPAFVGTIGAPEEPVRSMPSPASRVTAGLLALLLGAVGAHHFYIGRWGFGLLYLLFAWTFIPALIGMVEACFIFGMSDEDFRRGYGLAH